MVKLTNVIDTRTGRFHSVAYVKEKNLKWFVEEKDEAEGEETTEEEAEEADSPIVSS